MSLGHEAPYLLFGLLVATLAFAYVAKRFMLPYPIVFVIGGVAIALIPGMPPIEVDPQWIFLIVLPPLLWSGGWSTDWREFRRNTRPILLLAIGLVVFTTATVALVARSIFPAMPWAVAVILGAIVAPPDAVAAGAIFERFSVPRRVIAVLDGEGLVNDATALVIYRFALVAALTGAFSPARAALAFVGVALGGLLIGYAVGYVIIWVAQIAARGDAGSDSLLDNLLLFAAPYACYLSAEAAGVSGVLATVVGGLYVGRKAYVYSPQTRLIGKAAWDLLTYLLNAFVFIVIGLQLRAIVRAVPLDGRTLAACAAIVVTVIVVRFVWVYPAAILPRMIPQIRRVDPLPPQSYLFVLAWSGMRGIVSLAAALALPAFAYRGTIIVITFAVIFATLVGQGLSLIPILRWLRFDGEERLEEREMEVRVAALEAGIVRLRQLEPDFTSETDWEVAGRITAEYEHRIEHLRSHVGGRDEESDESRLDHRLQAEALQAERREIKRLRASGEIPDDIYRKVEYDLDLADARLQ